MISHLIGNIILTDDRFIVLDVNGVGYKVFTTPDNIRRTQKNGGEISFHTHLAVRENALDLYGFLERTELEFFELLITVSGIGPKTALGIMSVAPIEIILTAVSKNDAGYLTKTSGVGTKNAQKIVLELKGKTDGFAFTKEEPTPGETDAVDALQALGYSLRESREALKNVSKTGTPSEQIREALKILGK
ncbi:MAG: Holliday junction branch migration protein RuvA [Candidatus Paceibacterota bacterium]|jgi:Holliday junction DNA helicase RuvA